LLAGRPVFYRIVLPCLVWACMFIPFLAKLPKEPDTTTDALVYKIVTSADHKKDAVMIAWEVIAPTINFSLPADIESVSYPHLGRTVINNWSDMTFRLHDPAILKQFLLKMESVLNRGGQVWLIDVSHSLRPLDYRKNDLIDNTPFIETTVRRSDQIRSWLLTHARQVGRTQLAPGRDFNIILTQFAPIDADAAHALLPKIETLWQTVYGEQNDPDQRFDGLTILDGHAAKSTPVP